MRGRLQHVEANEQYGFQGVILGEDRQEYRFNSGNWVDKKLTLQDVCHGREVEFERKKPNASGNVYPRRIQL